MGLTITITPKELERQASLAFVGKPFKVFLVNDPEFTLTDTSTLAECEALELPQSAGYLPVTGTIADGMYDDVAGEYRLPAIEASFTGSDVGHQHNTVVLSVDAALYPHSIMRQAETVALQAGQSIGFRLYLVQNG